VRKLLGKIIDMRTTLTKFENAVLEVLNKWDYDDDGGYFSDDTIKKEAKKLLEVAGEELGLWVERIL